MAEPAIGVTVRYCGHKGTFLADIWKIGNVNVVHAAQPITMENLDRSEYAYEYATHIIVDAPLAGFWRPLQAIFVLPVDQVVELKDAEIKAKYAAA